MDKLCLQFKTSNLKFQIIFIPVYPVIPVFFFLKISTLLRALENSSANSAGAAGVAARIAASA